jgi:hypothetical protein
VDPDQLHAEVEATIAVLTTEKMIVEARGV